MYMYISKWPSTIYLANSYNTILEYLQVTHWIIIVTFLQVTYTVVVLLLFFQNTTETYASWVSQDNNLNGGIPETNQLPA